MLVSNPSKLIFLSLTAIALFTQGDELRGSMSREDAATICVQALETVPSSSLVFEAVSDKQAERVEISDVIKGFVGAEAVS